MTVFQQYSLVYSFIAEHNRIRNTAVNCPTQKLTAIPTMSSERGINYIQHEAADKEPIYFPVRQ